MNKIAVLMSTYNGNKYLEAQLQSIMWQNDVDFILMIRDDGSSDNTNDIIDQWMMNYPEQIVKLDDDLGNLGAANSFMYLLDYSLEHYPEIQYFAFADQDDVWLRDKLKRGIEYLRKSDNAALYYSKKTIVDENLNEMAKDEVPYRDSFLQFLSISNASGCTFIFNRSLAEECIPKPKDSIILHDAWIFRMAGCIKCNIFFDEKSSILYRQHENNVVGRVSGWKLNKGLKRVFGKRNHVIQKTLIAINENKGEMLREDVKNIVFHVCNYTKSIKSRIWLLKWDKISKYGTKTKIIWYLRILFNGI